MTTFAISHEWSSYEDPQAEIGETTARVGIFINSHCLTRNEDIWSKTIRDHVHVSLYPLAMWFASSWWRLHYEILPDTTHTAPSHEWRMSHEMAAANMGFIWPRMVFSADNDSVQIWAQAHPSNKQDAVRFLSGLSHAHYIPKEDFSNEISSLIASVIARLHEVDCPETDLSAIWSFVLEDLKDPAEFKKRRLEASLGFDPEGCSEELLRTAMQLEERIGEAAFSELSGAYAMQAENRLSAMQDLTLVDGIEGKPNDLLDVNLQEVSREPWQTAVSAARDLRRKVGKDSGEMENEILLDLLGLSKGQLDSWTPNGRPRASIAGPDDKKKMRFAPRKKHPVAQRFELARFIGDYLRSAKHTPHSWLVSADLSTARQKFQRAFAAEFLCPIGTLVEYLGDDFSETAIEDAANHFSVSEKTVDALLMNNGFLPRPEFESGMPYSLTG